MKSKRLSEVVSLISQPDFQSWWAEFQKRRTELQVAQKRYEESLAEASLTEFKAELLQKSAIDTLYRSGESEDTAATLLFEGTELENRSYRAVSDFEEQRFYVSELWYRLGACEKALEERREAQPKMNGKKAEAELKAAEHAHRAAREDYDRETERRNQLWDEVERIWAKSAEVNLLVAEHRVRAKSIRKEAEALFALAEEEKRRSADLRAASEAASARCEAARSAVRTVLNRAQDEFGSAAGADFLYFRQQGSQKRVFCIALIEDHDNYNVELSALGVYLADRQRGVAFLEPSVGGQPSPQEGDKRFEDYFLRGRKGSVGSIRSAI
jgi:hypothetical protein